MTEERFNLIKSKLKNFEVEFSDVNGTPEIIVKPIEVVSVCTILKEDEELSSIPVIAVTAFAMKGDEERIREGGCEAYISKPITVMSFMETIKSFLKD